MITFNYKLFIVFFFLGIDPDQQCRRGEREEVPGNHGRRTHPNNGRQHNEPLLGKLWSDNNQIQRLFHSFI